MKNTGTVSSGRISGRMMKSAFIGILLMCLVTGCAAKPQHSPYTYSQYSAPSISNSGEDQAVAAKIGLFLLSLALDIGVDYAMFKTDNIHSSDFNVFHEYKQLTKEIE